MNRLLRIPFILKLVKVKVTEKLNHWRVNQIASVVGR